MSQLPLRLVPPPTAAPPRLAKGEVPPTPAAQNQLCKEESPPRSAKIEQLRALVGTRGRVGLAPPPSHTSVAPCIEPGCVSTGVAGLDGWLHGWPRTGPIEVAGRPGAGRLGLVVPLLERLTREGRTVLLVDPLHQVHPPGLGGVDFMRLVLVRPPPERAAWTAEQVARSGAVDVLVLLDAPPLGRGGVRISRAAEAGNVIVFVLAERPEVDLPAVLRLEVGGWRGDSVEVRCTRSRDGRRVGTRWVAPWERPVEAAAEQPACAQGAPRLLQVGQS